MLLDQVASSRSICPWDQVVEFVFLRGCSRLRKIGRYTCIDFPTVLGKMTVAASALFRAAVSVTNAFSTLRVLLRQNKLRFCVRLARWLGCVLTIHLNSYPTAEPPPSPA